MSIPVAIADLPAAIAARRWAYLLTVRDDLRPHVVAVDPTWEGDAIVIEVGRGTLRNATERPAVTLCYPPVEPDGDSLIVDGTARPAAAADGMRLLFAPDTAVLHRPAPLGSGASATGCGSDCEPAR